MVSGGGPLVIREAAEPTVAAETLLRTPRELFWRRFRKDRAATLGLVVLGVIALLAIAAPLIVRFGNHHPPNQLYTDIAVDQQFGTPIGPNGTFWFGADGSGRDLFTRVLYGARVSLVIAFIATGLSLTIGVALGVLAGYYRGWVDSILSRLMDVLLAFPLLLLAIGIATACGAGNGCFGGLVKPGIQVVVFVIAFANWPYIARVIRGQVLSLREREFIEAARMTGASDVRIMLRELLPNLAASIIVYASLIIPTNVLFEAALSFLGVGVNPPQASWGQMISDSISTFNTVWWYFLFPGVFLVLTVFAFNLVGDGLRDALEGTS